MISGFDTALGEVTLVLFTTLALPGAIALVLVRRCCCFRMHESTMRARISTFMCIPLVVTMVGLVASATHLGNPANALYVFLHFGSSPLSNEVVSAVGLLACSGPVLAVLVFGQAFCMAATAAAGDDRGNGHRVRGDGVPCIFRRHHRHLELAYGSNLVVAECPGGRAFAGGDHVICRPMACACGAFRSAAVTVPFLRLRLICRVYRPAGY